MLSAGKLLRKILMTRCRNRRLKMNVKKLLSLITFISSIFAMILVVKKLFSKKKLLDLKTIKKLSFRMLTSEEWYSLSKIQQLQVRLYQVFINIPNLRKKVWWETLVSNIRNTFGVENILFALQYSLHWVVVLDDNVCV